MGIIELSELKLETLEQINCKSNIESNLYYDAEKVYKIFKGLSQDVLDKKERKIELLQDGPPLPRCIMPLDKLTEDCLFRGYSMNYIKDAPTLHDLFEETKELSVFFQVLQKVSQTLETIHSDPRKIVISDLHFGNILVDKLFEPHFIDIDSCKIGTLTNETNPGNLSTYRVIRELKNRDTNQNTDRLCLILCTLGMLFRYSVDFISLREFDQTAEQVDTLKNMRDLIIRIQNCSYVPEVPYLHEFIAKSDIDTPKQFIKKRTHNPRWPRKRI